MADIDITALRPRIDAAVHAQLARGRADLTELAPEAEDLLDAISALMSGGKLLRPTFLYLGYRAAGRPDGDGAVALASAMEFVQAAALIHDDVIDSSDTRRGAPTVHRALASAHAQRGWEGDGSAFGVAGAILAGNLCLGWADQAYDECGLPSADLERGRATFDLMRAQLMAGQYLDVVGSVRPWAGASPAERVAIAERVITYKSAKYSIQQPLLIGARTGGLTGAALAALAAYGLDLGIAFQLRDDVLGVFGDPGVTGKPAGDDLREGKRTVLIAHTLALAAPADRTYVETHLGDAALTPEAVQRLRAIIAGCGATDAVEAAIAARATSAAQALAGADVDQDAAAALGAMIETVTDRHA